MAMGMTYEQYWYGDVFMAIPFVEADTLRRERANEDAHLMGTYIYEALCDVSPLFRDLSKKKKPVPYRTKPYELFKKQPSADEEAQAVKNEQLKAQLFFRNWARSVSNSFKSKK